MPAQYIALIVGILFGLGVGVLTARASQRRDPIYGGGAAHALHYLTASMSTAMPVTVLACLFTGGFLYALTVAVSLLVVMYAFAMGFAAAERAPRQRALQLRAARGWTEEDARTSGL